MKKIKTNMLLIVFGIISLSGCGGGGNIGGKIPLIFSNVPEPLVQSVTPSKATVGERTVFTVNGENLVSGMNFSLVDCNETTEIPGGSSNVRQFSCMPLNSYGAHRVDVFPSKSSTTSLFNTQLDYQSAVASFDYYDRIAIVTSEGSLLAWDGIQSQVEVGTEVPPILRSIGDDYKSVLVSSPNTLAIKKDGTLWAWGANVWSTLGIPSIGLTDFPVLVGRDFKKVVLKNAGQTSGESIVGLKTDGSIWVWGTASSSVPNSYENVLSPTKISGGGYTDIARGSHGYMMALKADGSLWSFNRNPSDTPFQPVQIASGYVAISTSYAAAFALKKDGTLWNWDRNAPNQPLTGEANAANPVLVGEGFASISSGAYHTMAIKRDGTLWAGGNSSQGQFGDNTGKGGAFKQVGSGYVAVTAGDNCTIAQKGDGTFWAFGFCNIGDGKFFQYLFTPHQIPGAFNPPAKAKYTLGGTVDKRDFTGLTLSNGSNTVSILPNATSFSFPYPFATGTSYNVKVDSQPGGLRESCTVGNATGGISNKNISDVNVTCVKATPIVSTIAGAYDRGFVDGKATNARFNVPTGIALDQSGNIYVADEANHSIRKITTNGDVSTFAGNGLAGADDGVGKAASFKYPIGLAIDKANNLYVADSGNNLIRKITPKGQVSTLAGSGSRGRADGLGTSASFSNPYAVAVDDEYNVYVADTSNYLIRKISPLGLVSTFAGTGYEGKADGKKLEASFLWPRGIAVDQQGNVYVTETFSPFSYVRKISSEGDVSTILTNDSLRNANNGTQILAIAVDSAGFVYMADQYNHLIYALAPDGGVRVIAGTGQPGHNDGQAYDATFTAPHGLAVFKGSLYVTQGYAFEHFIRKIAPP